MTSVKNSKFLSLVLRHAPETIGIKLDPQGWADLEELVQLSQQKGRLLTLEQVFEIVRACDKQRFALSEDKKRIRASQGHSIAVDLALPKQEPPEQLYHGTATRFLDSIRAQGLLPGSRQHVHMSKDIETAIKVGKRHGEPAVLVIRAHSMWEKGHAFYLSENGVWLAEHVPVEYTSLLG